MCLFGGCLGCLWSEKFWLAEAGFRGRIRRFLSGVGDTIGQSGGPTGTDLIWRADFRTITPSKRSRMLTISFFWG